MIDPATLHDLAADVRRLVDRIDACVPVIDDADIARLPAVERHQRGLLIDAGIGLDKALVQLCRAAAPPPNSDPALAKAA